MDPLVPVKAAMTGRLCLLVEPVQLALSRRKTSCSSQPLQSQRQALPLHKDFRFLVRLTWMEKNAESYLLFKTEKARQTLSA